MSAGLVSDAQSKESETGEKAPGFFVDASASPLLTGDMSVLVWFLQFLAADIRYERVPVSKIELRGSVDPEDDSDQIIVRLWINRLSHEQARDYHFALGKRVDVWKESLTDEQKRSFAANVSFQVRREPND